MGFQSSRFLGEINAAKDKEFETHFIEAHDIKRIIDTDSDVIYGAKGVGKTALNRALTELNNQLFFSTKTIDLNNISFNQIYNKLIELHHKSDSEIMRLSSNIWRNVLIIYGLESIHENIIDNPSLKKEIEDMIDLEGFKLTSSNTRILNQIQRIIDYVIYFSTETNEGKHSLSPSHINQINTFPFNKKIITLLDKCNSYLKEKNKKILISLDGFDSIINHTPESRKAIFAGLVDAIFQHNADPKIDNIFCFKAFLPEELTDNLENVIWDADKSFRNTHYLKWSYEDLKKFLLPRLKKYSRTKSNNFEDVWHEFMPEKIKNPVHGSSENTFDYILRHTLYRPRQLLMHTQNIIDLWDEKYSSFKIDPSFITKTVSRFNYKLSNYLVGQLEYSLPGLENFLHSNYGTSNVINVYDLNKRIRKVCDLTDNKEVSEVLNLLYNLGIYGFAKNKNLNNHNKQIHFDFAFANDIEGFRQIHSIVTDDDLMALTPMLHEYCGCSVNKHGAICPKNGVLY